MKRFGFILCFSSLTIQAKDYYVTPADISKLKEILGNNTCDPAMK